MPTTSAGLSAWSGRARAIARRGWLSNEAPGVLPGFPQERDGQSFVLVRDGVEAIAYTDPHGTWLDWARSDPGITSTMT
jgi:hypothetical protein